jgi:cytoskeletal protein RodZ
VNEHKDDGVDREEERSDRLSTEETVGEILLAARERRGLSLEEVSQESRIAAKNLEYLETDNFEALPAKVYVRGFLRTYAAFLGLDVEHLLNKYEVQSGQTHKSKGDLWEIEAEVVEEKLGSANIMKRILLPAIAIVVLLVVLFFTFLRKSAERAEPPQRPTIEERLPGETGSAQQAAKQPVEETREPVQEASLSPMELRIAANPTDSTWFELITISTVEQRPETTSYNFLLLPGRVRSFEATDAFLLKKIGNAGGFVMELNGQRLPLVGRKGRVVHDFKITREDISR